jgi:cytochrome c oxidase assembly protein subunit 11
MKSQQQKNRKLAISMCAIVLGMVMLTYASVPLYDLFCRVTGYGGTTQTALQAPDKVYDRVVTIRFNADTNPKLPWDFKPEQIQMKVKVGENHLAFYSATNLDKLPTTGTSVYNVTPHEAGIYFNKIQCFCFEEQLLNPAEKTTFPVSFFIDPDFMNDPNMKNVDTITLSYTFFPITESRINSNKIEHLSKYSSENPNGT